MTAEQGRLGPGHQVAGRYQVARLVGAGEMGEVYDVRDMTSGYAYALKLLRAEAVQNQDAWMTLCNDAQRASVLEIETIAKAYEYQIEPTLGVPYVMGEYVTFPSLHTIVSTQGPMALVELEALLRVVTQAIDLAHRNGLVHRALKPQNIFANHLAPRSWQARITDFGMGSSRALSPPPPGWTATPGWLSAEQADPSTAPSPAMDVYALGLIAFYALTGRSPFLACQSSPPDLNMLWAEMTAPLPPASRRANELGAILSPSLDPWFERALAVSPTRRFSSAGEMSNALFAVAGSSQPAHAGAASNGMAAAQAANVAAARAVIVLQPAMRMAASGVQQGHQGQQQPSAQGFAEQQALAGQPFSERGAAQQATGNVLPTLPKAAAAAVPIPDEEPRSSNLKVLVPIGIGAVIAILVGIVLVIFLGGDKPPAKTAHSAPASASAAVPAVASATPTSSAAPSEQDAGVAAAAAADAAPQADVPDAAAPEAKPTDALVTFACTPKCDEVVCDSKKVSDPQAGVRLAAGRHTCQGKAAGYTAASDSFTVVAGEDIKRELKLNKIQQTSAPPAPKPPPKPACGGLLNPCK